MPEALRIKDGTNDSKVNELKLLHKAVTKNYNSELDLFREYLSIGCKIFSLETGIVSRIEGNTYTILAFSSPLEGLSVGQTFALEDTYCREVFNANRTVAFPNIGADKRMCQHPVYVNMKLESYVSSPVFVNERIYGTINFTDRKIRNEGFSNHEFDLIEIMSNTIGRFIESHQYKDSLIETNEKLNQLVGIVAHDIKNPLGNISSISEMLLEDVDDEDTRKYLNMINNISNYSIEMMENILSSSALNCGKITLNIQECSTEKLITDSWQTIDHMANAKNIQHIVNLNGIDTINVDPNRMKQTLCNLYSNAIKFSYRGSKIQTVVACKNGATTVSVVDSGQGIPREKIGDLFKHGTHTSTSGTEGEAGTGYGLPLVAQIVHLHGGKIEVESEEKKGTTFHLHLNGGG